MGWFAFIILGLIAGVIARIIIPGKQPGGFWLTLLLGVLGAVLGGWLGGQIFNADLMAEFWSWESWLTSVVGAIVVILIVQAIFGRKKA
jgi:uncharacterized membrane protein YeaQ/YmgE (transglycosylase-associated protein family)